MPVQHAPAPIKQQAGTGDRDQRFPHHLHNTHPPPGIQFLTCHQVVFDGESSRLTLLPAEGSDNPHPRKGLGGPGIDLFPLLADHAKLRANSVNPGPMRHKDGWQEDNRPQQHRPVDPSQDCQTADQLNDGPPGIEQHPEDQFPDAPSILTQNRGDATRTNFLDPMQWQTNRVLKNLAAQI